MSEFLSKETNYQDILSLVKKNPSSNELIYLVLKQYFTTNEAYFILLNFLRLLHTIILSGNYYYKLKTNVSVKVHSIQNWIRNISVYHLLEILHISDEAYMIVSFIFMILSLIRILILLYLKYRLKDISNIKYPKILKYHIFMEQLLCLFLPYILEYLSFIYYIYFYPNTFIIKKNSNNILLILVMIINALMIFYFNFNYYFLVMCSNKIYTTTIFEAYSNTNNPKEYIKKRPNAFKFSNVVFYIKLILPNLSLFYTMELYLTFSQLKTFVIIISFILIFGSITLNICTIHKYNYSTFVNLMNYTLLSYVDYSIILDFILYIFDYPIIRISNEIIYVLLKLFLSYLTFLMCMKFINKKYLQNKIIELLFQEKNNKKEDINILINSFLYFNELMTKVKEKNDLNSAYQSVKFLNNHIKDCKKLICNCQLIKKFILDNKETKNAERKVDFDSKGYISNLLIILNYLYESIFIEYDYYNNYDLTILIAEHFCHLRNNPTMAFSFVNSLIVKQRKKLKPMEMVVLYELLQKYIYFIKAKVHKDLIEEIQENKSDLLSSEQRSNYYKTFYINLKMSNNIKKLISAYIDNEIKIIKYKNIFDDSLSFKFDDNNEKINYVKINFFNQNSTIDNSINDNKKNKRENNDNTYHNEKNNSNLLNIIQLLKNEQKYHQKIIESITNMEIFKGMPVFIIFKFYLFFDIFEGGKIASSISDKLYEAFSNISIKSMYDTNIIPEIYSSLIKRYKKQNCQIDSKYFAMWEYKKELRTIYFSEVCGLKLGYRQKDIINEKIDVLMPKEFCKSHQNLVKQIMIYGQCRYFLSDCRYFFDSTSTILYPIISEGGLIYDISKNFVIISESVFNYENEYRFMLNNNFELMGHTINFEDEYSLNQNIFQTYNLKIMDILQVKLQTLQEKFSNEFNKIQYQKKIRQGKTEEYFTPQLYVPPGEKHIGMMNANNFNSSKNYLLSKIIGSDDSNESIESKPLRNNDDNESEKSIEKEKSKQIINDLLINPSQIIFNDIINFTLNKYKFIENLHKELTKIPDNDLMFENNKENYNLIVSSKSLISKLLLKNDLRGNIINIKIKMSYYYDKPFYFITIDDPKKLYVKISIPLFLKIKYGQKESLSLSSGREGRYEKPEQKKSRNRKKSSVTKTKKQKTHNLKKEEKNMNTQEISDSDNSTDMKDVKPRKSYDNPIQIINIPSKDDFVMEKIEKYRKEINKEKFIFIIKCTLSIICVLIFVIYFFILKYQKDTTKLINSFFLANLYNFHTKDNMLLTYSYLLRLFIGTMVLNNQQFITTEELNVVTKLPNLLKVNFHNFTEVYYDYNLKINHDFGLFYKERTVLKLKCYWEQIPYKTDYLKEMDTVIYDIYILMKSGVQSDDIAYFLFEKGFKEKKQKVKSISIQMVYYFTVNYDSVWEVLFTEMEEMILDCYNKYIKKTNSVYYSLQIIQLLLYLVFYCCIFTYLYYANIVITKNIIFLFLDFNEDQYDINKYNQTGNMTLKLLKFKQLINDFDLDRLQIYADNLNYLNSNKSQHLSNIDVTYLGNEQHIDNVNHGNNMNNSNVIDNNSSKKNNESTSNTIYSRQTNNNSQQKILINPKGMDKSTSNKNSYIHPLQDRTMSGNNSSINYLNKTNSKFFGMNGQTTNVNLMNNNTTNNDTATNKTETINNYMFKKNNKNNNNENKNSYENDENSVQDLILNRSNKSIILIIKIYMISVICMTAIVTFYIIFEFYQTGYYIRKLNNLFSDFTTIMNRYSILYYYFNALRSVVILPTIGNKNITMDDLIARYNEENKKYKDILSYRINNYKEIKNTINSFSDYKDNSISIINNTICENDVICMSYLNSDENIVNSGIEFAYESSITEISKFFSDYSKLNNKTDEVEIKANILEKREYTLIERCLNLMFYFVKEKLYSSFKIDEKNIINKYNTSIIILNVISILFSVFNLSFTVIFIFITISNYSEPIKASTYRIHYSFYYIKKYNISKYRKCIDFEQKTIKCVNFK